MSNVSEIIDPIDAQLFKHFCMFIVFFSRLEKNIQRIGKDIIMMAYYEANRHHVVITDLNYQDYIKNTKKFARNLTKNIGIAVKHQITKDGVIMSFHTTSDAAAYLYKRKITTEIQMEKIQSLLKYRNTLIHEAGNWGADPNKPMLDLMLAKKPAGLCQKSESIFMAKYTRTLH